MSKRKNKHALKGQGFHKARPAFGRSETTSGQCRICGCTDEQACMGVNGPCSWVDKERTICSECV